MTASARPSAKDPTDAAAVGFPTVIVLAAFAGAVDVCGLTILKDIFVSFMSGNTTLLGAAVADGDRPRVVLIGSIAALFVAGSAAGTIVAAAAGRLHVPAVLLAVSAILVLPVAVPVATIYAMTFAMGALNAAMDHAGSVKVSITYVTGTLVKVGQGLGHRLRGEPIGWGWLQQGAPWAGMLGGAIAARYCLHVVPGATVAALPFVSLALGSTFWLFAVRRAKPVSS